MSKTQFNKILRETSRSFYLTLRVLPNSVRVPISLAYLLARATDTVADTDSVPVESRLDALSSLLRRIQGQSPTPTLPSCGFISSLKAAASPAESELLSRFDEVVSLMETMDGSQVALIRQVLTIIVSGQDLDLRRFGGSFSDRIVALETAAELNDYTYRVAGCVGEFWCQLTRSCLYPEAPLDDVQMMKDGARFGQGLQMVNILRDLPRDLTQGRCYLPLERLCPIGLSPQDLTTMECWPRLKPLYDELLSCALAHLEAGWRYVNSIPKNQWRMRLACAWPVLIGVRTLIQLREVNPLDSKRRVKVGRREVQALIMDTAWRLPFSAAWGRLFEQAKSRAAVAS